MWGCMFMKLHPVFSIIFGVITTIIILVLGGASLIAILVAFVFGGFAATYHTRDQRIVYSVCVGIIISLIVLILGLWNAGYGSILFTFVSFSLVAGIGGLLGKYGNKINIKISQTKYKINRKIKSKTRRFTISKTQRNILAGIIFGSFMGLFLIASLASTPLGPTTVTIQSSGFSSNISQIPDIDSFSTVTWINNDTKPHRILSDSGLFDSGNLSPGQNYSHNFYGNELGTYPYHDSIDSSMKGNIQLYIPNGEG